MKETPRSPKTKTKTIDVTSTKAEALYAVLRDYAWHATRELVRMVGHTFAVAKFKLVRLGYAIEKRRHPEDARDWQYRLQPPNRLVRRSQPGPTAPKDE